jgi:hypothetical protein
MNSMGNRERVPQFLQTVGIAIVTAFVGLPGIPGAAVANGEHGLETTRGDDNSTAAAPGTRRRNVVTVSKRGGDYSDPIAAAKNAYEGDVWCALPRPREPPCVIEIHSGIYVLPETLLVPEGVAVVGQEQRQVLLLAARRISPTVASRGPLIAKLSIVNDERVGTALVFAATLRSVTLRARGTALTNIGSSFEFPGTFFEVPGNFDIADSEIYGGGSGVSAGIVVAAPSFRARHSRIHAGRRAISFTSDVSTGDLLLRDCEISVAGADGGAVTGIEIDATDGRVEIIGGSISVQWTGGADSGNATGLDLHDIRGANDILLRNTSLVVGGAKFNRAVVLDKEGFGGVHTFDGVNIAVAPGGEPTVPAVGIRAVEAGGETHLRRTHIDAPLAMDWQIDCCAQPVEIQQSFINGDVNVDQAPTQVRSSVVTGALRGTDVVCRNVYDANFVLHRNACPPP